MGFLFRLRTDRAIPVKCGGPLGHKVTNSASIPKSAIALHTGNNKNPALHLFRAAGFLGESRPFRFHSSFELEEQDFFRNTGWFYPKLVLFRFISRNRFKKSKEMPVSNF